MLDTSTVILLSRFEDASLLPAEPLITAVTLAELSVSVRWSRGTNGSVPPVRRNCSKLKRTSIRCRLTRLRRGRFGRGRGVLCAVRAESPQRAHYDAMIAATAIANDLAIFTCNPGDFAGVDDLEVVSLPIPRSA